MTNLSFDSLCNFIDFWISQMLAALVEHGILAQRQCGLIVHLELRVLGLLPPSGNRLTVFLWKLSKTHRFCIVKRGMNVWHVLDLVCQKLKMSLQTQKISRHHRPYWKWTNHRPYWKWTLVLQLPIYIQLLLHLIMMTVTLTCLVMMTSMMTTMMSIIVRMPIQVLVRILGQSLRVFWEPQKPIMEVWTLTMSMILLQVTTIAVAQAITMILILGIMALHLQEPGTHTTSKPEYTKKYRVNKLVWSKKSWGTPSRSSLVATALLTLITFGARLEFTWPSVL